MEQFECYDWNLYKDVSKTKPIKFSLHNKICNGDGKCFKQNYFNTFVKDYNIICLYNCEKIKCKNNILCGNVEPEWWSATNNGLCTECNVNYGEWKHGSIPDIFNAYCPICMEDKESIKMSNCNHSTCIECYKKCNMDICIEPPIFPYNNDTELSYMKNPFNKRWTYDALIIKYEKKLIRWNKNNKIRPENYLTTCCICRS